MSNDRLESLKRWWRDVGNIKPGWITRDFEWLVSEVERLRGDLVAQDEVHQAWMTMAKEHIEQSVQGERVLRATIAALQAQVKQAEKVTCDAAAAYYRQIDELARLDNQVEELRLLASKAKQVLTYVYNHKNKVIGEDVRAMEAIVGVSEQIEAALKALATAQEEK